MKKHFFFLIFILAASFSQAQEKIKIKLADNYFEKYSYSEAVTIYEDLAKKNSTNVHYVSRAAECYRLTGNTPKAEEWYAKLANMENTDPSNILYYAEMLDGNKKYDDAKKYYAIYKEKNSADSRASHKLNTAKQLHMFYKDSAQYKITNLTINSENSDFGFFPFSNETFFFASNRKNRTYSRHTYNWNNQPFLDLYTVKRNADSTFASPQPIRGDVNSRYHEGPIFVDASNNTLYVTRNNYNKNKFQKSKEGVNKLKLYMVNPDGDSSKTFSDFVYNNNEYSVGHATLSKDGQRLYFVSDMPGGIGGTDIYVSIKEDGKWGAAKNLGKEINTEGNEMFPFISGDDELYFSSNGFSGLGGLDIYVANRENAEFRTPKNLGYPINSNTDDFSFYISTDKKSGYFSSNRSDGKGDDDIYSFNKKLKQVPVLMGRVTDEYNQPVSGAKIFLKDFDGNIVKEINADEKGMYSAELDENSEYVLYASKEQYSEKRVPVSTKNISSDNPRVEINFKLMPDIGCNLIAIITDKKTQKPVSGVKVNLVNMQTNSKVEFITNNDGKISKPLSENKMNDNISYQFKLEKEGYLTKTETYNKLITKTGDYLAHLEIDLSFSSIEKGLDIGKLYDLKPIYFDLSKWDIRSDAKTELDKIVKVMKDNRTIVVELGSHTDCRSSTQSNLGLSDKRAKSSVKYIVSQGIESARIYGKGYGETQLFNSCACEGEKKSDCPEEEHQKNRRTEFKVVKF